MHTTMIYWGKTGTGDMLLLGQAQIGVLKRDRGAPADGLELVFQADKIWEPLFYIYAYKGETLLFYGIVDEQHTDFGSGGISIRLSCRSIAALLLDNEALPQTIQNPSLRVVSGQYIEPLGLTCAESGAAPLKGILTVEKGDSCWKTLETFCTRFLDTVPVVSVNGLVLPKQPAPRHQRLPEAETAQLSRLHYKKISAVWIQGVSGSYENAYENGSAAVTRRRYLSGVAPLAMVRTGERQSMALTAKYPGFWDISPGDRADITAPGGFAYPNCIVDSVCCRSDKNGAYTTVTVHLMEGGETNVAD